MAPVIPFPEKNYVPCRYVTIVRCSKNEIFILMAERKLPNFFLSKRVPCFQSTPNVQLRLESEVASWFSRVNVNQACMPFLPAARRWPAAMPAWQRQARVARVVETVGSFCPLSENTRTTTVWSGAVSMYSIHDVQQGVLRVTLKDFTRKGRGYLQADLMPVQNSH